ncbi:MAG: DUF2334 domain-containing protein [Nanoarchaeota archaeon]
MENKVIIRIDDIGRKNYSIVIKQMLEELSKRKMPFTLGVIASELEDDNNYIVSLKETVAKNKSEFALHGYYHKKDVDGNPEFKELSKEDASKLIHAGKTIMQEKLEITPITFIPPWNVASYGTKEALIEEKFTTFSGDKDEFEKSKLFFIGYNVATANFQPHILVTLTQIKEDCEKSFEKRGYCVIMIHPQDYLIDDVGDKHKQDIDSEKYQQFIHLLDYLEDKKRHFTTFSEMSKKF